MNEIGWRYGWVTVLALFLAVVFQPLVYDWLSIGIYVPDTILITMLCCSLMSNRSTGAFLGFVAGFLYSATVVGKTIPEFCISMSAAGFWAAWVPVWIRREYIFTAVLVVFSGTIIAETTFLLLHPGNLMFVSWMKATFIKAVYNGVLAIPTYALLKRFVPQAIS